MDDIDGVLLSLKVVSESRLLLRNHSILDCLDNQVPAAHPSEKNENNVHAYEDHKALAVVALFAQFRKFYPWVRIKESSELLTQD